MINIDSQIIKRVGVNVYVVDTVKMVYFGIVVWIFQIFIRNN